MSSDDEGRSRLDEWLRSVLARDRDRDAVAPDATLELPLDADGSQRAAIARALAGETFVLAGAAGTGKSQTLANLIARALGDGKTALVVAETEAARDALRRRLAAAGVADFCLDLEAGDRVIDDLGRAATRAWRPVAPKHDRGIGELAASLDAHVDAMHVPGPFGVSVHDAVARLVALRDAPSLGDVDHGTIDVGGLAIRRAVLADYTAAATAVAPIAAHPWRSSTLDRWNPETAGVVDAALDAAARAADELARKVDAFAELVPGVAPRRRVDLEATGALFAVAARSPRPGADLVAATTDDVAEIPEGRLKLSAAAIPRDPASYVELARRRRKLLARLDVRWSIKLDTLDLDALAGRFRKWAGRFPLWRWFALRKARADVRGALAGGRLPDDLTVASDLEVAGDERAIRRLLGEAANPARRWFGELGGGDPDVMDLDRVDAAMAWVRELRAAFEAVPLGGSAKRDAAWRALVAQVSGAQDDGAAETTWFASESSAASEACAIDEDDPDAFDPDAFDVHDAPTNPGGPVDDDVGIRADSTIDDRGDRDGLGNHDGRRDVGRTAIGDAARIAGAAPVADGGLASSSSMTFAEAAAAVEAWRVALARLSAVAGVPVLAFDTLERDRGHLAGLHDQIAAWRAAIAHLRAWVTYVLARAAARAAGLSAVVAACESGALPTDRAVDAWERALYDGFVRARIATLPALAGFDGATQHARAAELAERDRGMLSAARSRIVARLAERAPRPNAEAPEMATLLREVKRVERRALRDVLADVAPVLSRLTPCIVASADAIARHLDPAIRFDLVIVDDAPRIAADVAIDALARGDAAVIAGDPVAVTSADSLQATCSGLREHALEWHYRGRHEDMFAFVGRRYHDDRVGTFPAPGRSPDLGVSSIAVDGSLTDAVVDELLRRLRDPVQARRSIAVVTFDESVRARIATRIDDARLAEPALEPLFGGLEPVTIEDAASLAAERDVVLVAIGDDQLAGAALANAIGRAREQVVVMSDDADADDGDAGALLAFARDRTAAAESRPPVSALAAAIGAALEERGWIVRHQIGGTGYRIDLAVVDPDDPARFVLGIETDGAMYASSPRATDRDRLRPSVLHALGWRLHRIWALDWWRDPVRETARVHTAVVGAIAAARQSRRPRDHSARTRAPIAPLAAGSGGARNGGRGLARGSRPTASPLATQLSLGLGQRSTPPIAPYQAAPVPAGRRRPDDLFDPRHAEELGRVVERVLEVEAPIHLELLARRVAAYFGIARLTDAIVDHVRAAVLGRGRIADGGEPDVVWRTDQDPNTLLVRVAADTIDSRRDIIQVPLVEIAAAAVVVVERTANVPVTDLVRDAARLLGFARITDEVTERVLAGVELAAASGAIKVDGETAARA
jgi:hypothetical protein